MNDTLTVLGFAGSLRKASYNRALLRAAFISSPEDIKMEIFELDGIPPYNQDIESPLPEKVKEFKDKIKKADAILIVTPEYNYSMSGVLKNAIDWGSRPYGDNSFEDKPVAIMSASTGILGGARAQYHLRQSLVFLNMHPVNRPEVFVTSAAQKFDANGNLIDLKTKELITQLLVNLVHWTRKLKSYT
jgi:chromate reductase, NAD(P)H dehydrogenase (quinone)